MRPEERKIIWAGILGNALELYDYTVYAFFASIIAVQFFPSDNPLASLMATFGVYASGFLLRPFGALFLGAIGDKYGRKRALELSILLMAGPTLCMGLLPTYQQVGLVAPLLLTVMRLLQGVSVGGEIVGSYTFLVEHAENGRKGFFGTWSLVGAFAGKWTGSLVAILMTLFVSTDILEDWGWRIPFVASILFTAAGYYIRQRVSETPVFQNMKKQNDRSPLKDTCASCLPAIVKCIACFAVHTSTLQLIFSFFPVYFKVVLGFSYTSSLLSNLAALTVCMAVMPLSGILSDKIGRKPILLLGAIVITISAYPAFMLIAQKDIALAIATHLTMAVVFGLMHGPFPAMIMELFPDHVRYTASAIAYNVCVGTFGALTPLMATWLTAYFDSATAPALWIVSTGLISIAGTWAIPETHPAKVIV